MIVTCIKPPTLKEIEQAEACNLPAPKSTPYGKLIFQKKSVVASTTNGNVMTIVLVGGIVFECMHNELVWMTLEQQLRFEDEDRKPVK
jgi:hypothetical protein